MRRDVTAQEFPAESNAPAWAHVAVALGVALLLYGVLTLCGVGVLLTVV